MMSQRRAAAHAAFAALLLLGMASTSSAIDEGTCIIEIPVKGDLGVLGTISYSEKYENDKSATKKAGVKVPLKDTGSKGTLSGVIPVVFPSATACKFASTATNKDDPGYAVLVAALADAKIGTAEEPKFQLTTTEFAGTFVSGNPDSGADKNTYVTATYTMSNITMNFDLVGSLSALKPGGSKTFKTAVTFAEGSADADVSFQKGTYSSSFFLSLDLSTDVRVKKASSCKVTLADGAFALSCANLNLALDAVSQTDDWTSLTAKLVLKGGALSGTGALTAAKPFSSADDTADDTSE